MLFSGSPTSGGGGGALLTTMTLVNTSGSTQATNFVTDIFGHPFKKGDIPTGTTPKFELTNGTDVPFSMGSAPIYWSDGSLKWAPFMLRVPTTIAGSGTLTINIMSGGTTPSASGRALSDFATGSTDLEVSVTGLDNLSGTWTSNLNQGVGAANTDNYVYMDGQAGKVWRVRASFRQSSADHGQLEGYWYVQALQDASSGLYGTRALIRIAQPWYTNDTDKTYRTFSAWTLKNGASTIRDYFSTKFGTSNGKTFTWSGSGSTMNSTANGFDGYIPLRLTNSGGALPTGLSTGVTYVTDQNNTNTFAISTGVSGGGPVTPSGAGSGTNTASIYPGLTMFGSLFSPGTSGKADYVQAGGSVSAEHTTRIQFSAAYWITTGMVPRYMVGTVSPTAQASYNFTPMGVGPISQAQDAGGERDDIGVEPNWLARHFLNQDAGGTQTARIVGLAAGDYSINLRSKTTYTIPVANNTTYTGMPAANTSFQWKGTSSSTSGFTNPTNTDFLKLMFASLTFDHQPEVIYYPTLVFGEPQFNDMLTDWGSHAITSHKGVVGQAAVVNGSTNAMGGISSNGANDRDPTVNGTHYYGVNLTQDSGTRGQAWSLRTQSLAAAIAGGYEPAGVKTREYLNDTVSATFTSILAYIALLPTFVQDNGFWGEPTSGDNANQGSWQLAYLMNSVNYAATTTENSSATDFSAHLAKYWKFVVDNFGVWSVPYYYAANRMGNTNTPTGNSGSNPYLTTKDNFAMQGFTTSWTNGSATLTMTSAPGSGYAPTNGDQIIGISGGSLGVIPNALTKFTPYYMVNVSGSTFELSATVGGSAITMTDSGTHSGAVLYAPNRSISSNTVDNNGDNYMPSIASAINWLNIIDSSKVDSTMRSTVNTRYQAAPSYASNLVNNPKYAIGP